MQLRVGDSVRIRVTPDVDETLWDSEGIVAAFTAENRLVLELDDGADCTVNPDQVELVKATDVAETFRGTAVDVPGGR